MAAPKGHKCYHIPKVARISDKTFISAKITEIVKNKLTSINDKKSEVEDWIESLPTSREKLAAIEGLLAYAVPKLKALEVSGDIAIAPSHITIELVDKKIEDKVSRGTPMNDDADIRYHKRKED